MATLGIGKRDGLEKYIRPLSNGRETRRGSQRLVIDLYGLSEGEVRREYPEVYQFLTERVRYDLDADGNPRVNSKGQRLGREWNARPTYRNNWWIFGEPRSEMRPALSGLTRYVGTVDTSPHRTFEFIDGNALVDDGVVVVASDDAADLALLSSKIHVTYAMRAGGWLGVGDDPRWNKSLTFDPFPFPDPSDAIRAILRDLGEELDATRKSVQAEHPDLTLTGLYNVLEKVRAGTPLDANDEDVKDRGRVLILKDLHDQIDRATADAYGWPHDLTDEHILERLVTLNAERAAEEAAGHVRWLRPDYQIPRFAKGAAAPRSGQLDLQDNVVPLDKGLLAFPKDKGEQVMAIRAVLQASSTPMDAAAVSRAFKQGGKKIEQRVVQALNTLVRYAEITALPNGAFAAKRAA